MKLKSSYIKQNFHSLIIGLLTLFWFACTDPVQPQKADCDYGWQPCDTDSTICCEIDTLGIYPSRLEDVHIVNENDIWVVG
jgi:hypothetical protein